METILVKCVEKSLNEMMLKNAIFVCERLCAEFPSEAQKWLNHAICLHVLALKWICLVKLKQHYCLLKSLMQRFQMVQLVIIFLDLYTGAAEEAVAVFSEAAVSYVQEYHLGNRSSYLHTADDDQSSGCVGNFLEDGNLGHLKHSQDQNLRDLAGNCHEAAVLAGSSDDPSPNLSLYNTSSTMLTQLSDIAPAPICRNETNPSTLGGKSLPNTTRAPRRKFAGEGKSGKVFERLVSDSGPRRSPRLAAMRANSTTLQVGDGTGSLSSSYLGIGRLPLSSKSTSVSFSSSVVCRDPSGGKCAETLDDASSQHTTSSTAISLGSERFLEHERTSMKQSALTKNETLITSGISDILCLFRLLGEGYRLLCMYRCQDALLAYQKLSQKQYNTGWVLSQVGRAYYELVDYMNSDYAFSLAHQVSPYTLEGMDIYSTVLYHLQEDMKLSHLAQELILIDRLAPQSWCAIGNCYSLQKDHETALKNFHRAVQINSRHAYAYTLLGHEYVALEEYETGVKCYQSALQVDPRHYNAWYGLGMIYLRQERLEFAHHHFQNAFYINPCSSVILCYVGTTLHALKRNEEALGMMEKAIFADKKNPLPLYQKAKILMTLGNFDKALEVLEELKEYAPRESSIYAMMGKVYEQFKMYDEAVLHFGIAMDLNPNAPDVATIKAAMENLLAHSEIED
ncbi:cell division cycle protein 27 homolog B isoform X3 [Jatropha curcas]|uniref:cell division cycle protein 27 homolog B isoform X3 n=3 Tax=Jatropha curcas TaxID=180498 RepID=UPI001894CCE8|nr:cell division cycle protein 27 homolog B isoform X3 [Jatropha curcas]